MAMAIGDPQQHVICPACGQQGVLRPLREPNPYRQPTRPKRLAATVLHEDPPRRICLVGRYQYHRLSAELNQLRLDRSPGRRVD